MEILTMAAFSFPLHAMLPQPMHHLAQHKSPFSSHQCKHFNAIPPSPCRHTSNSTTTTGQQISVHGRQLRLHLESRNLDEAKTLCMEMRRSSGSREDSTYSVILESMLVDAFMKSGRVDDAFWLFDLMHDRNVVTWTSMIAGCRRNPGLLYTAIDLFVEMLHRGICPNDFACNAALGAATGLGDHCLGRQIHSLIMRMGFERDARTESCLIDFYSKCGSIKEAMLIFSKMLEPDLVAFTSLITGFCVNGLFGSARRLFEKLIVLGIRPNERTLASILEACDLVLGQQIHTHMVKSMLDRSLYTATALLELYSRNSMVEKARLIFLNLAQKSVVTWSSMISCCIQNEEAEDAVVLFQEMIQSGMKPNEFTFSAVLDACGLCSEASALGQQIHCLVIKLELFPNDDMVSNALLTMYARTGCTEEMEKVFDKITNPDMISWCSAISGYFQNGFNEKAIELLRKMLQNGEEPNDYGLSSVLSSCANLTSLDQGRQFHCLSLKLGSDLHICVGNALVNMYAKCGSISDARLAFQLMPMHDVMSWNSLVHGCVHLGMGNEALHAFNQMTEMPDQSTFIGILSACSHMGYLEEALSYFKVMEDEYGITPSPSHYTCLVDMMGRAGKFTEAMHIIQLMPSEPDVLTWKSLLGSCRLYRNIELGRLAAAKVMTLSPTDSAGYVLLSNLHGMHGEWDEAECVRKMMEERGVRKGAGQSWIEVRNVVHAFVAGDRSHAGSQEIHEALEGLVKEMKTEDCTPDLISYDS